MELTDLKTKGRKNGDGAKDYIISTPDGEKFFAISVGSQFDCNGIKGTLKSIKTLIASGEISNDGDGEAETQKPDREFGSTWDCVDPVALLILANACHKIPDDVLTETLDCYGRLNENGSHDIEWAIREMKRCKRLPENSNEKSTL